MAVNLSVPDPKSLHAIAGVTLGVAQAGIRKAGRKDLLVMRLEDGARVAGVFTRNRFCAALVVNTGNANAGTGEPGLAAARATCEALGALISCGASGVLPFSTGVVMEP